MYGSQNELASAGHQTKAFEKAVHALYLMLWRGLACSIIYFAINVPAVGSTDSGSFRFHCKHFIAKGSAGVLFEPVPLFERSVVYVAPTTLPAPRRAGSDYDQFLHALLLNKDMPRPQQTVDYEFRISPRADRTWSFSIVGGSSSGGASFAVQTQSGVNFETIGSCLVFDQFNGTYTVECLPTPARDAIITVELRHIDYGAFLPFGDKFDVHQQLKVPLFDCEYAAPSVHNVDCERQRNSSLDVTGGWWTEARTAKPRFQPSGWCKEAPFSLSDCMRSYTDVYMFGESHMRFFYDYITQQLGIANGTLELKHSDDTAANMHYFATHYITKGPEGGVLIDALQRTHFSNNSLVLVGFGSWQLHGKGLTQSILDVKDVLVPALSRVMAGPNVTRIIVFTGPAKYKQEGSWAGIENTASMAALLEAVQLLMPQGIAVLDIVHATQTFMESITPPIDWDCWNDHQCSCHIMCRLDGTATVTGRFGKEILRQIMQHACLSETP